MMRFFYQGLYHQRGRGTMTMELFFRQVIEWRIGFKDFHASIQNDGHKVAFMGDDGWIKRNYAEYRRFVYHSDVVWFRGKVTNKYVDENGECCVDIETSAVNQRGENTAPGESTIILSSRENGTSPLDSRLD